MKKCAPLFFMFILVMVIAGCDNDTIEPGTTQLKAENHFTPSQTAIVLQKEFTPVYEAIGTVRPLTESVIESQVSGQVIKVLCQPGTPVKKGQELVHLDDRQLTARYNQAKEGLILAKNNLSQVKKSQDEVQAALEQAQSAYNRSSKLFETQIVSSQQFEKDKSAFLTAKARVEKTQEAILAAKAGIRSAEQIVKEAKIALDYSKIVSPANGVVVKRMADPGDLAVPGKPLLVIQTSGALRLEANIREGLIHQITLGETYTVKIANLDRELVARIDQIIPYADPATRTFLIKALLPDTPGIYPGMFGRLFIPLEKSVTLTIPKQAVYKVGQLEMAYVKRKGSWKKVFIKTGKTFGEDIEVLSGLLADETIGYPEK